MVWVHLFDDDLGVPSCALKGGIVSYHLRVCLNWENFCFLMEMGSVRHFDTPCCKSEC